MLGDGIWYEVQRKLRQPEGLNARGLRLGGVGVWRLRMMSFVFFLIFHGKAWFRACRLVLMRNGACDEEVLFFLGYNCLRVELIWGRGFSPITKDRCLET